MVETHKGYQQQSGQRTPVTTANIYYECMTNVIKNSTTAMIPIIITTPITALTTITLVTTTNHVISLDVHKNAVLRNPVLSSHPLDELSRHPPGHGRRRNFSHRPGT